MYGHRNAPEGTERVTLTGIRNGLVAIRDYEAVHPDRIVISTTTVEDGIELLITERPDVTVVYAEDRTFDSLETVQARRELQDGPL